VDFDTVLHCAGLMVLFYVTSSVLSYTLHAVMLRLSRSVSRQMRHDVFWKLTQLPVGYFDRFQTGDIISTITYDIDTVNQSLSTDLLQILQTVVTVVVSLVMMLSIAAFAAVRTDGILLQLGYRIGVILAAAAVSNEIILPLERANPNSLLAVLHRPLMGLQSLKMDHTCHILLKTSYHSVPAKAMGISSGTTANKICGNPGTGN
jgi:ABC-type multidrug transport system fused ATPase/permease subunit